MGNFLSVWWVSGKIADSENVFKLKNLCDEVTDIAIGSKALQWLGEPSKYQ